MLPLIFYKLKLSFILNITWQQYLKDPDIYVAPHITMRYHQRGTATCAALPFTVPLSLPPY